MKTLYMFELWSNEIKRTVVECEEKPKTYIPTNGGYFSRIRKDEIGVITGYRKNRVFLFEDNVKAAAAILLKQKNSEWDRLRKQLSDLDRTIGYLESMTE